MSHKAGESFFERKREWSHVKDMTLSYYLRPYLQKVKQLGKPIVLIDLFAGPGTFEDGSEGSPLLFLEASRPLANQGHQVQVILVEQDVELFQRLQESVKPYGSLAEVHRADCMTMVDSIAERARQTTTFLYVDPFTVSRLHLGQLSKVFQALSYGRSVELLFVFMAPLFFRWARACMTAEDVAANVDKLATNEDGSIDFDMLHAVRDHESIRMAKYAATSAAELDAIAGGSYWREYLARDRDDRLQDFVDRYCEELRTWIPNVYNAPVYAEGAARVPKYWLIFGTRYRPAIDLINRAIKQARVQQVKRMASETLFAGLEPPPEVPLSRLPEILLKTLQAHGQLRWNELRWSVTEAYLGAFTDSEINTEIKRLVAAGKIGGAQGSKVEPDAVLRVRM